MNGEVNADASLGGIHRSPIFSFLTSLAEPFDILLENRFVLI
jgi:hypothetical protein